MKKYLILFLLFVSIIMLAGCGKHKSNDSGEEDPYYIIGSSGFVIVDKSANDKNYVCADAIEDFYEDDKYVYSFSCVKSRDVIVEYDNGTKTDIKEALKSKKITITDLDKFNIKYNKKRK